jgi:hypothetical protein
MKQLDKRSPNFIISSIVSLDEKSKGVDQFIGRYIPPLHRLIHYYDRRLNEMEMQSALIGMSIIGFVLLLLFTFTF